jgi:hypothetical protein
VVYDNEVSVVLVYLPIQTLPEWPYGCGSLVASSTALVHAVYPQYQKTYQWKNEKEDSSRISLPAYDMISWL